MIEAFPYKKKKPVFLDGLFIEKMAATYSPTKSQYHRRNRA